MAKKITNMEQAVRAFMAACPAENGAPFMDWILDWQACYPQFRDGLTAIMTAMVFSRADGAPRPFVRESAEEKAAAAAVDDSDLGHMVLTFPDAHPDPTPSELRRWLPQASRDEEAGPGTRQDIGGTGLHQWTRGR